MSTLYRLLFLLDAMLVGWELGRLTRLILD